ncbi:Serine/threonine protein kinase [Actinokineospora diospyrosa]|uniref:non-specific serine/threonine protein kinase n=1 Tax=Actinokineospora diospyrosa TaxID=103728 RepID=A0ABT1I698_9PSEU|nr:Serine/threonine protein kinase [Actinokineospora diospyrosa]
MGGRFELLEPLGSGGMGTVWRARDVGLQREVAIKEVRPADAALFEHNPALAAQQRERVLRESRALARLQHPNVVSIYQIIEDNTPYPWIVMELVQGASLDSRLREGTLAPAEAARIGRDVLRALRAAHTAGILHRDVKPGNVLLRPDGSAVLTDFGIAALHDSGQLTATGEVIGSPEYIAPERLLGDETKTASDLWSLAMLLYVAVEGYHPLRRATTMATLAAVMTEPVPPPRRSGALGAALSAVLVPDPANRPTPEVLDRMLAAAEHGAPMPLGPPTPAGPAFPAQPTPSTPFPAQPTPSTPFPTQSGPGFSPPSTGPWKQQQFPAYWPPGQSRPNQVPTRKRTAAVVVSLVAVALVITLTVLLTNYLSGGDDPSSTGSDSPGTEVSTPSVTGGPSKTGGPATPPTKATPATTTAKTTTAVAVPEDLLTPAGARQVATALSGVMGGTKVSDLTIYAKYAMATAPAATVKNGFDDFEYRNGTATRKGPDTVDADRAVVDLNKVNWDALPALWERADKDLGVAKPTMRYIIVDTGLIDHVPALKLYVTDEYGGAYLLANLDGKVLKLFARDK